MKITKSYKPKNFDIKAEALQKPLTLTEFMSYVMRLYKDASQHLDYWCSQYNDYITYRDKNKAG